VGDEIGAALIGARLVQDVMRLCFLMEKQYAPYPKWWGTAFNRLTCAVSLSASLSRALSDENWYEREEHLCAAYEYIAAWHNTLGITEPLPAKATPFFSRPFHVIWGEKFSRAICAQISDPAVRYLAELPLIGGVDQFSDGTGLLSEPRWRRALRNLWA
jgi:hypothetical protein